MFTGHGCFIAYLHRFGNEEASQCSTGSTGKSNTQQLLEEDHYARNVGETHGGQQRKQFTNIPVNKTSLEPRPKKKCQNSMRS